jgi:hypothetical protein
MSGSPDGYWQYEPNGLELGADSSYFYRLFPNQEGGDLVFRYQFGGGPCVGLPATICLDWVKFVDANGDTTFADILGGVTLFGGSGDCGLELQQVAPGVLAQGLATSLELIGGGFASGLDVALGAGAEIRSAESVEVLSPAHARAVFDTRGLEGEVQVIVVTGSGDTMTSTARVADASFQATPYEARSVILWTRPGRLTLPEGLASSSLASASAVPSLAATLDALGVESVESCSPASIVDPQLAAALADPAQLDIFVVGLADTNIVATCQQLSADTANIVECHPNWLGSFLDVVPGDALMPKSWHLRNTGGFPEPGNTLLGEDSRASRAWSISTGGSSVLVGVLDTGSWTSHPDLVGRYSNGPIPPDLGVTDPHDNLGHGVPVAGIIAAKGNGGGRAVGVNWSANIYSIKVGNDAGMISEANVCQGLDYARAAGCSIANLSIGRFSPTGSTEDFFYNAFHAGMFLSVASGNYDAYFQSYPAEYYPYAVSVGASLYNGKRWSDGDIHWGSSWNYQDSIPGSGSSWGNHLRILAPGGRFIATAAGPSGYADPDPSKLYLPAHYSDPTLIDSHSSYWGFGGTSASAPVVSGAASLIRSVAGDSLGAEELAHLLGLTARKPQASPSGYQAQTGWGIMDIQSALSAVRPGMWIERRIAFGGIITDTSAGPIVDLMDFPGLPEYQLGCSSSAYNIRRTVAFPQPFVGRPLVLKRIHGSVGALTIPVQIYGSATPTNSWGNPLIPRWEPAIDTVAAYPDSCVLKTRVYALYKNGQRYWWPCPPDSVRFAFTVVGIPQSALSVEGSVPVLRTLELTVGPNPTRGAMVMDVTGRTGPGLSLELLDVQGRRVRAFNFVGPVGEPWRVRLDVADGGTRLQPGLYFARASSPSGSVVHRLVVLR